MSAATVNREELAHSIEAFRADYVKRRRATYVINWLLVLSSAGLSAGAAIAGLLSDNAKLAGILAAIATAVIALQDRFAAEPKNELYRRVSDEALNLLETLKLDSRSDARAVMEEFHKLRIDTDKAVPRGKAQASAP